MSKKSIINTGILLLGMLSLSVSTSIHAQQGMSREEVSPMGLWLDARRATFTGKPVLLHLRTGHERALRMPEPVRLTRTEHHSEGYDIEITGDVIRFYPTRNFDREPVFLTGIDSGTDYILRVRSSAFGIRQPLQLFRSE